MDAKSEKKKEKKKWEGKIKELAEGSSVAPITLPNDLGRKRLSKLKAYALEIGLKTKISPNSQSIVYKRISTVRTNVGVKPYVELTEASNAAISGMLAQTANQIDVAAPENSQLAFDWGGMGELTVPPLTNALEFTTVRRSLPIYSCRHDILKAIDSAQVLVISSSTGTDIA